MREGGDGGEAAHLPLVLQLLRTVDQGLQGAPQDLLVVAAHGWLLADVGIHLVQQLHTDKVERCKGGREAACAELGRGQRGTMTTAQKRTLHEAKPPASQHRASLYNAAQPEPSSPPVWG